MSIELIIMIYDYQLFIDDYLCGVLS